MAGYEDMILKTDSVELYEDDVDQAISEACEKYKVEDLVKEGQTRWKAVLHFVGKRLFPDRKVLRDKKVVWIDGNSIPTNNNRYDYYIINILCDYYIQLSRSYNKLISSVAFAEFINVSVDTVDNWKDTDPSSLSWRIWKKLQGNREDSLKDKAIDSGNVMGVFQVGRREYQWDMPGVREETGSRRALTAAELPRLGNTKTDQAVLSLQGGQNGDNLQYIDNMHNNSDK